MSRRGGRVCCLACLKCSAVVACGPLHASHRPSLTALRSQRAQIAEQRSSIARQRAALESVQISSCAPPASSFRAATADTPGLTRRSLAPNAPLLTARAHAASAERGFCSLPSTSLTADLSTCDRRTLSHARSPRPHSLLLELCDHRVQQQHRVEP